MVLIADSGATKTDWCVIGYGGSSWRFRTGGINAAVMPEADMRKVVETAALKIAEVMLQQNQGHADSINEAAVASISELHFYGAGLLAGASWNRLSEIFAEIFCRADVFIDTDLMAAARALWGRTPGVVAILGTGSNSCLYDGERIVKNVRPGGFVLGDEGGGASLGRMLLADFVKGLVPAELSAGLQESGLDYQTIVKNVYASVNPAAYLASFAPFVFENIGHPYMRRMVEENFRAFVRRSLCQYRCSETVASGSADAMAHGSGEELKVGVVGSLGCAGKDVLMEVAAEEGIVVDRFLQSPMDGLIEYYRCRAVPEPAFEK